MTTQASSSRRAAKFLAIAAAVLGIMLGLFGTFAIPRYQEALEPFGVDLPFLTKLVMDFRYLLWAPLFLSLALWRLLRSDKAKIYGYAIFLVFEVVLILLSVISMYLPIFNLC